MDASLWSEKEEFWSLRLLVIRNKVRKVKLCGKLVLRILNWSLFQILVVLIDSIILDMLLKNNRKTSIHNKYLI